MTGGPDEQRAIRLACRDMAELVTPYLEGALPLRARLAARVHLLLCEACRRYFAQMRRTIRFLGAATPSPPRNEDEIVASMEATRRET